MSSKNRQEQKKNSSFKKHRFIIVLAFLTLLICLLLVDFRMFQSYQQLGIVTVVPVDSLVFLLIGIVLLGVSCFSFLQLYQYKTGKLFAVYVLLLGVAIALAPCNQLGEVSIRFLRSVLILASAVLLFWVVGYMTLLVKKKLFQVLQIVLMIVTIIATVAQILSFFPLENVWIYIIAEESVKSSILLSALLCIIVMSVNYKSSNSYARKQSKILLLGIGIGGVLFLIAYALPNVYVVQTGQPQKEMVMEVAMTASETVDSSLSLLLFSGISISMIFMLLHREFALSDIRLKVGYFILTPLYFGCIDALLFTYANCSLWLLLAVDVLLACPMLLWIKMFFTPRQSIEAQTYEWRLIEEIDKEKQELSSYLHDEVLQSLIAFYRQVQSDQTGRYQDMKTALQSLISQIRQVSHTLYPTMVEDLGLEQSLYSFVEELEKNNPTIKVTFQYMLTEGILPKQFALTFYRVAKELVTNAVKHSGGTKIHLTLSEDENGYCVQIQDNGNGFGIPQNGDLLKSPHMGLYTVKRQIASLQGKMNFESNSHSGTSYTIYFPKIGGLEN
ncbi:sensor histidine kinase [Anaerosporobacter sp.]|uniref:sensor histidine kinase n=1 Tax=Anaerosporobacter sp. TaxID=1872529 RepID=UPI00286F6C69|nr:ATP-binding protein [Anaerosporobacter sp.]